MLRAMVFTASGRVVTTLCFTVNERWFLRALPLINNVDYH